MTFALFSMEKAQPLTLMFTSAMVMLWVPPVTLMVFWVLVPMILWLQSGPQVSSITTSPEETLSSPANRFTGSAITVIWGRIPPSARAYPSGSFAVNMYSPCSALSL